MLNEVQLHHETDVTNESELNETTIKLKILRQCETQVLVTGPIGVLKIPMHHACIWQCI